MVSVDYTCIVHNWSVSACTVTRALLMQGNRLSYCKVNGDVARVADACNANPDCKAFVMVTGYEGQLKGATGPTRYMESAVTFVKA
jgi:hypothetical protein